jgi:ABC-type uncharacterized transport system auxiliary subunit
MKLGNLYRLTFLFVIIVFVQGCISSSPGKRYYQLHVEVTPKEGSPRIDKVLMVGLVEIDRVYNDYRIVYRHSPFELNYYSYEFWIKKPDDLVKDAMVSYFSECGAFNKVITKYSEGDPDIIIRAKVNAVEEYDMSNTWYARLAIEFKVKAFHTGETVMVYSFDRKEKLLEKKVGRVSVRISAILEDELAKLLEQLNDKFQK